MRSKELNLFTYPPTARSAHNAQTLDWSSLWSRGVSIATRWMTMQRDLQRVSEEAGQERVERLVLYPRLHSGLGIGVGAQFARRFRLTVEQPHRDGVAQWSSHDMPTSDSVLDVPDVRNLRPGPASIEISISRDVTAAADAWIREMQWPRVALRPTNGPSHTAVPDAAHAAAMANQIGHVIRQVRDQRTGEVLHLFIAAPMALEILIGMQLNACFPIQCYTVAATGEYMPAYRLP